VREADRRAVPAERVAAARDREQGRRAPEPAEGRAARVRATAERPDGPAGGPDGPGARRDGGPVHRAGARGRDETRAGDPAVPVRARQERAVDRRPVRRRVGAGAHVLRRPVREAADAGHAAQGQAADGGRPEPAPEQAGRGPEAREQAAGRRPPRDGDAEPVSGAQGGELRQVCARGRGRGPGGREVQEDVRVEVAGERRAGDGQRGDETGPGEVQRFRGGRAAGRARRRGTRSDVRLGTYPRYDNINTIAAPETRPNELPYVFVSRIAG